MQGLIENLLKPPKSGSSNDLLSKVVALNVIADGMCVHGGIRHTSCPFQDLARQNEGEVTSPMRRYSMLNRFGISEVIK